MEPPSSPAIDAAAPSADGSSPKKSMVGGHSCLEAGGSRFVPTVFLLLYRLTVTLFLFANIVYLIVVGHFEMHYLTNWSFTILTISFALLTISSLLLFLRRESIATPLAQFTIPIHFVAATAALYIVPVYFIFLGDPPYLYRNLMLHGLSLIPIVIDVALGAFYKFRLAYIVFAVVYLAAYICAVWIRFAIWRNHADYYWPYKFLDYSQQKNGVTVGYYFGFFAWLIIAAIIVFGAARLAACCGPNPDEPEPEKAGVQDDEEGNAV